MSELRDLLERAARAYEPPPGALDRSIARARRRHRSQRLAAAFLAMSLAAGSFFGLWSAFHRSVGPAETSKLVRVAVPPGGPGSVSLPTSWSHTSVPISHHTTLALIASTNQPAVSGALRSFGIDAKHLSSSDAYVEVEFETGRNIPQADPMPAELQPSDFTAKGSFLGEPLHLFTGATSGSGGDWVITYWAGREAGAHLGEIVAVIRSLRLAGPAPSILPPPAPKTIFGFGGLVGVHMVDASTGWAWDCTHLWHTMNGGATWADVTPVQGHCGGIATAFLGERAWVTMTLRGGAHRRSITVYRSVDGGQHWSPSKPIFGSQGAGGWMTFIDPLHGWLLSSLGGAAGSQGVAVLRTTDGGVHWMRTSNSPLCCGRPTPHAIPASCDKTGIAFANPSTGWVSGVCASNEAFLYVTHDGGTTWAPQPIPSGASHLTFWNPPSFMTPLDGIAIAKTVDQRRSLLLRTLDGGATWAALRSLPEGAIGAPDFIDETHGWMLGGSLPGSASDTTGLLATNDGGQTWHRAPARGLGFADVVDFVSATTGFAVYSNGEHLLVTHDGGRTWVPLPARIAQA
jgi:photosystem II stability/assembly factor-like uncharacterized protein